MISSYILIKTEIGKVSQIISQLKKLKGVKRIASTAGEFDLIVRVEVKDLKELSDLVTGKIHKLSGITSTQTHIIAKEEKGG